MFCKECGHHNQDTSENCNNCGTKLVKEEVSKNENFHGSTAMSLPGAMSPSNVQETGYQSTKQPEVSSQDANQVPRYTTNNEKPNVGYQPVGQQVSGYQEANQVPRYTANQEKPNVGYQPVGTSGTGYQNTNINMQKPPRKKMDKKVKMIIIGVTLLVVSMVSGYFVLDSMYGTNAQAKAMAEKLLTRDVTFLDDSEIIEEGLVTKEFYQSSVNTSKIITNIEVYDIEVYNDRAIVSYAYETDSYADYGSFEMYTNGDKEMLLFDKYYIDIYEEDILVEDFRMELSSDSTIYFGEQEIDPKYVTVEGDKKIFSIDKIFTHTLEDAKINCSGFEVEVDNIHSEDFRSIELSSADLEAIETTLNASIENDIKPEFERSVDEIFAAELAGANVAYTVTVTDFTAEVTSPFEYRIVDGHITLEPTVYITSTLNSSAPAYGVSSSDAANGTANLVIRVKKTPEGIVLEYIDFGL